MAPAAEPNFLRDFSEFFKNLSLGCLRHASYDRAGTVAPRRAGALQQTTPRVCDESACRFFVLSGGKPLLVYVIAEKATPAQTAGLHGLVLRSTTLI